MKTAKVITILCMLISLGLFISSCTSQNSTTYQNKSMTLMNDNEKNINNMNEAMSHTDYKKAEEVRKTWEKDLNEQIATAEKESDFKGDNSFKTAIVTGLNNYKKIVTQDYKKLIELRSNTQNADASQIAEESTLLNNINTAFENTGNAMNKASDDFEKKYAN